MRKLLKEYTYGEKIKIQIIGDIIQNDLTKTWVAFLIFSIKGNETIIAKGIPCENKEEAEGNLLIIFEEHEEFSFGEV